MRKKDTPLQVTKSNLDVDSLVASFDTDPGFRRQLREATVLIVPTDLAPDHEGYAFPDTTRDVFEHLRLGLRGRAIVDSPVPDEDYVEFEFHSEEIILPVLFVAQSVVLPFVISLLASYVSDRLKRLGGKKGDDGVTSEFHVMSKDGTQMSLRYKGPAETYERVMLQGLRKLGVLPDDGEGDDGTEDNAS